MPAADRPGAPSGAHGAPAADSAGVPWSGRVLGAQPFAGDDGTADPVLGAALAARSGGGSLAAVVAAWAPTRALVPVVAVLGEDDDHLTPVAGDKSADMALATLTLAEGRRALPAFTSTAALAAWDASARPVPVEAARAAQAAVVEGCDVVLLDPAGPVTCVLPRPAVWAVAQGREWTPPAEDPAVLTGVANLLRAVPGVRAHRVEPDPRDADAGVLVVLGLPPGLAADEVQAITTRTSELLAADPVVAERAGSLRLALRTV